MLPPIGRISHIKDRRNVIKFQNYFLFYSKNLISAEESGSILFFLHGSTLASVHLHLLPLQLLLADLLLLGLGRSGGGLGVGLLLLDQAHLDVARAGHVRVDATVGTVGTTTHVRSAVHLDE